MSWAYRHLVRPVLFSQDSETAHHQALTALGWCGREKLLCDALTSMYGAPELPVEVFGLKFPNPVGLAAGMDKFGQAVPAWASLGFGFTELGGITAHEQPGNPQPRLFRAIADQALVNRMGFNNPGAKNMAEKLSEWKKRGRWPAHPVGMNLGKSKITSLENAADDYAESFRLLREHANFFVVNVSSPNTPNLRDLQDKQALNDILEALQFINESSSRKRPVLVKVAPDLSFEALDQILQLAGPQHLAGIVATNTTITRPVTSNEKLKRIYAETGGLSGRPLRDRSTEMIRHIYRRTCGTLPIIGVGGIFNADDAWEKITAGASLVQIYTGLIYEGPAIAKSIVTGLKERLQKEGLRTIQDAVGIKNR